MGALDEWRGPFDEVSVKDFLKGMRPGDAAHVYREDSTASGAKLPDHRGWLQKEADGGFAVSTPIRGTRISGDQLGIDEAVDAVRELDPDYVVHDA